MLDTERAWAAGFLDGEGSFTIDGRPTRHYRPMISATQIDRTPLFLLRDWFGGHVYTQRTLAERRATSSWQCSSRINVLDVLTEIRPFLIVKAAQADLMLEYLNGPGVSCNNGHARTPHHVQVARGTYAARMSRLNRGIYS